MPESTQPRPPYVWALAVFGAVFALYLLTLAPTVAFWDAPEYITAAKVLGIPHPPGNPLFTLLAHVWGLMPLATDYARRINIFAAFCSAAAGGLWFLVAERWLHTLLHDRTQRIVAAFAGIFASATAWTVWNQSVVNEKVYTVSLLSIALVAWFAVRWADEGATPRRDRWLLAAVYILALTSTNHTMGLLGAPVLGVYVLLTDWRVLLRPKLVAMVVLVAAIGVTPNYVYMPMRAAQFPAVNEGEPIGFFSKALSETLNRTQYLKPGVMPRQPWVEGDPVDNVGHFGAQLQMYWHYWSWQWGKDLAVPLGAGATGLFTVIGLGGLLALLKRDRRAGLAAASLTITLTLLLIFYLNFKFGYFYHLGDKAITNDMREVRDRDYFFIASFAFFGVLLAAGFAMMMRYVENFIGDRGTVRTRQWAGFAVAVLALIPLLGNRISAPRNHETLARDYAVDMLQSVEPYGILITAGDNDTFPLWYAQEVMGVRRDVTLANLSLMGTDWHVRQMRRRQTPEFNAAAAAPIWRGSTDSSTIPLSAEPATAWPRPAGPVFAESLAELDSIPAYTPTPAGTTMAAGKITMHFSAAYASRSDLVTALLIHDNIGKRPIYFAITAASYPEQTLGLAGHLLTQGMVRQVMPDSIVAGGQITDSEYLGMVDMARTKALMFGTYHTDTATRPRPGGWYDPPSADMLGTYLQLYAAFAPVLQAHGDSVHAAQAMGIAEQVRRAIQGK
jgi:transmembrane protein TMEM260 (protein O-mannosyltransferase)